MTIVKIFGEVLREIRLEQGFSQEKLAELSNLTPNYISFLERGLRQPTISTLFKLSSAFKITTKDFIDRVELRFNSKQ
ncbi:XRE family transcriptional regulator [Ancylomarina salipaludis]|uniref:XRE family transcriptional regulator n=1 Tax=Ancylomarina salipaludis TaxID=2501299 RepID=A0A4Q1JIV6_9BACT|nr:helix-turn-helix transcriptional regulator [Ancylomarina salipaludis]RXQ89500.1 XRE family transcriptional regulator [Ancylomarina salipaludis]